MSHIPSQNTSWYLFFSKVGYDSSRKGRYKSIEVACIYNQVYIYIYTLYKKKTLNKSNNDNKYAHNTDVIFPSDISEFDFDIRASIYTHWSGNSPIKFATSWWLLTQSLDITRLICKRPQTMELCRSSRHCSVSNNISQTTLYKTNNNSKMESFWLQVAS